MLGPKHHQVPAPRQANSLLQDKPIACFKTSQWPARVACSARQRLSQQVPAQRMPTVGLRPVLLRALRVPGLAAGHALHGSALTRDFAW